MVDNILNSAIEELLDGGFIIDEAKNIVDASNNEHMTIQPIYQCVCGHNLIQVKNGSSLYDGNCCYCNECGAHAQLNDTIWRCEQNCNHKTDGFDICNNCIHSFDPERFEEKSQQQSVSEISNNQNYLCKQDIRLLLKILKKLIDHPNENKYKDINVTKLTNKIYNYEMCMDVLKEAGFRSVNDGSRLVFDNKQYDSLQSVYSNISIMEAFNSNQYISDKQQSKIDSGYLLSTQVNRNENIEYDIKCELSECLCLNNIIKVLKKYKSYTDRSENEQKEACIDRDIYEAIRNKYDSVALLNDFNHLLDSHSHEFEDIYNMINNMIYNNNVCELSKCLLMRRHHRDRHKISENEKILNELYFVNDDVASQQLLDRVHCHYFHSFDIGYKLSKKDKQDIIDKEKQSNEEYHQIVSSKIFSKNKVYQQNKFSTMEKFSYGHRFYYWPKYKNCTQLSDPVQLLDFAQAASMKIPANIRQLKYQYIEPKYTNIKSELLCNDICKIGWRQWQNLLNKAGTQQKTNIFKTRVCQREQTADWYGMKYGDLMRINHVIAMIAYSNFDLLSFKFSQTYREQKEDETYTNIKERHGNYYWMARYLRECVECFGMAHEFGYDNTNMRVYHGVNQQFLFTSMYAHIYGPVSTTTSYHVAVNFCHNKGLILDLIINISKWRLNQVNVGAVVPINCCNMQWISDYPNEKEMFCIGGIGPFMFNTIIEPTGTDYVKYMQALKQITNHIDYQAALDENVDELYKVYQQMITYEYFLHYKNNLNKEGQKFALSLNKQTREEKQLMFRLLSHQIWKVHPQHTHAYEFKSIPQYFDQIMDLHLKNVTEINFIDKQHKVIDYFLRDDKRWINMDILNILFPNVKVIAYISIDLNISMDMILKYITSNQMKQLNAITLCVHPKWYSDLEQLKIKYSNELEKHEWFITVKLHREKQMSSLISKDSENDLVKQLHQINNQRGKFWDEVNQCFGSAQLVMFNQTKTVWYQQGYR